MVVYHSIMELQCPCQSSLRAFTTNVFEGLSSDCHREIQRRDQRLKSIQKTFFGIVCLLVGIAAYYYTHHYTETSSVLKKESDSDKNSSQMVPMSLDSASFTRQKIQNIDNFENDKSLRIIKFDKIWTSYFIGTNFQKQKIWVLFHLIVSLSCDFTVMGLEKIICKIDHLGCLIDPFEIDSKYSDLHWSKLLVCLLASLAMLQNLI